MELFWWFCCFRLAIKGRTIIFSIHQPRYSIYRLFDGLMMLSMGEVVYHGPTKEALPFFKSIGKLKATKLHGVPDQNSDWDSCTLINHVQVTQLNVIYCIFLHVQYCDMSLLTFYSLVRLHNPRKQQSTRFLPRCNQWRFPRGCGNTGPRENQHR